MSHGFTPVVPDSRFYLSTHGVMHTCSLARLVLLSLVMHICYQEFAAAAFAVTFGSLCCRWCYAKVAVLWRKS